MTESTSQFGNTEHDLLVYAKNTLGTVLVRDFNFTVPSSGSKFSWYMHLEVNIKVSVFVLK